MFETTSQSPSFPCHCFKLQLPRSFGIRHRPGAGRNVEPVEPSASVADSSNAAGGQQQLNLPVPYKKWWF